MNLKNFFKVKVRKKANFYLLLFFIVIFFIGGYVHNNNISFIVMFFLFSVGILSFVFGRRALLNTKVSLLKCECFAKTPCVCKILIQYPFKKEMFEIKKEFDKRGYNTFSFMIKSSFPFDLVEFSKKVDFKVLIYPKIKGKGLEEFLKGNELSEFEDLKRYEGEGISKIHWPSVAKGEIMSKKFANEESEKELVFDINKINAPKEEKISQITKWVVEAKKNKLPFKVILDKEYRDYDEILKKLALY
ncbi:DUF58 domain-containing protein [Caminibacter sp.]